jgi:orotidine-5'-phosphate decarboxylase
LIAQDWQEQLVAQLGLDGVPIEIKKFRELRRAAIGQNVTPPGVRSQTNSHVVGHDVQHLAHTIIL